MSDILTQKEFRRLKTRLTRAINSKDPEKIFKEANYGLDIFENSTHPDDWYRWQRAKEDAQLEIRRAIAASKKGFY